MKEQILLKGTFLIAIVSISLACKQVIANENNLVNYTEINAMNQPNDRALSKSVKVVISQLVAREEIRSPSGIPPQLDRDIGFASVFLSLENYRETNKIVTIQNVEIQNASDSKMKHFDFKPRLIELKPLENSIVDIHLRNKTGYDGKYLVKVIVTYKIDGIIETIESKAVEVNRH